MSDSRPRIFLEWAIPRKGAGLSHVWWASGPDASLCGALPRAHGINGFHVKASERFKQSSPCDICQRRIARLAHEFDITILPPHRIPISGQGITLATSFWSRGSHD